MSRTDSTTIVLPLGGDARREQARWKARQAAYRIAAQCEHLLDELARSRQVGLSDTIGRVLLATRSLVAMTADPASVEQLFDADGTPTARLRDARRRMADAFDAPARNAADLPGLTGTAIQALRRDVDALFTHAATTSTGPQPITTTQGILIVDDEPLMITLLKRAVTGMGYAPTATSSGSEALRLAAAGGIDLVLTDIEMPEMNGLELLSRLKSNEATRKIPVIVISSLDDMSSVTRCIELGAEDHISKPFEPKLLTARVKASLDRKRLHDEDDRHRGDVARLISAAEAVEDDRYTPEAIASIATRGDGLARLARVFDRMVRGLKSREDRLRHRLTHLRDEVSAARSDAMVSSSDAPAESSAVFAVGTVVSDRYEIRAPLGEGGMGTVYVAYDRELGVDVALKSVRSDVLLEDPTMIARLKSEILLARRITHRNVVRAHDHGQWKGDHFITMELVRGITLADLLDQRGRLTPAATLSIGVQLCDALATAHETEVIHRDIKPANLLIDQDGTLKVMDFGIARSTGLDHQGITAKGFIVGTPRYMAPEVLTGGILTAKTDLFAVGVVLFECLTGGRPFDVDTPAELVAAIYKGFPTPLDELVPDVTPEFARLVQQQLAYDPAGRATSARELAQRLGEVELPDSP